MNQSITWNEHHSNAFAESASAIKKENKKKRAEEKAARKVEKLPQKLRDEMEMII